MKRISKGNTIEGLIRIIFVVFFFYVLQDIIAGVFRALVPILTKLGMVNVSMLAGKTHFENERLRGILYSLYLVTTLLVLGVVIKFSTQKSIKAYLGFYRFKPSFIILVFFLFSFYIWFEQFVLLILYKIQPDIPNRQGDYHALFRPLAPLTILSTAILVPIVEEIQYRGFLFSSLQGNPFGKYGTIIVSAFIFGYDHLNWGGYSIAVIAFLLGLLAGWLRYHYRSIWLPIFLHGFKNFLALGFQYLG